MLRFKNFENNNLDKIDSFGGFLFEGKKLSVPFVISERLEGVFSDMKHPVAKRMIEESKGKTESIEATLIDYDNMDTGKFTYTVPNKFVDSLDKITGIKYPPDNFPDRALLYDIMKKNVAIYEMYRTSIKIGRLINKLYPDEYNKESVEKFVNEINLVRNRRYDNFDIVEGDDLIKYYNLNSYDPDSLNGSELDNSCMSYPKCGEFLRFFADNKNVKLLILRSEDNKDKIVGRALLWDLGQINGEDVDGKFMDRIYFIKNYQKDLFVEHAENNSWYHKETQHSSAEDPVWNPNTGLYETMKLKTKASFKESSTDKYPYLDTLKWFYVDEGFLSNTIEYREDGEVYFLEDIDGDYLKVEDGIWVNHYMQYVDQDDLVWCEYGEEWRKHDDVINLEYLEEFATEQYAESGCVQSPNGHWVLKEDAVSYLDAEGKHQFTTPEYAKSHYKYSKKDGIYYEKAVRIYMTDELDKILTGEDVPTDYARLGDDDSYFEYYPKGVKTRRFGPLYFHRDLEKNFVLTYTDEELRDDEMYHKKYDKNGLGKYEGEWVTKFVERKLKEKKGSD